MESTYAVSVRLPNGQYATVTVIAANTTAAASAAAAMTDGTVSLIRKLD